MPHTPTRREFLGATALAAGTATFAAQERAAAQPSSPKRNIVLFVYDDLGMGDAGCYGHPVLRTPALDALAADGTRFTNAFCTTPSCSASRSVLLTGLHNHANGQFGHSHAYNHFTSFDTVRSLPAVLRGAGYHTINAGKCHVAPDSVYPFETRVNFEHSSYTDPVRMAGDVRPHLAVDDGRPFFLLFGVVQPHRPFLRDGGDVYTPEQVTVPSFLPDIPECREELSQYYGSVSLADKALGRLVEVLRETGHYDDTLLIAFSDNGIAFPGAKTCLYEPGMHLPCVARNPLEVNHGVVCEAMMNWCDIAPSILDYAGLPAQAPCHGRSFLPVMGQVSPEGWDEVYASHTFHEITMYYPMRVVRERRWKLIWNIAHGLDFPFASDLWESATWQAVRSRGLSMYGQRTVEAYLKRPEFELYDLETDPHEVVNLAGVPEHAGRLEAMKVKLRAFQERTSDPWVLKWEHE